MLFSLLTSSCAGLSKATVKMGEGRLPLALFRAKGMTEKKVALTIDDAPSVRTGEILAVLKRHGARATFFIHTDHMTRTGTDPVVAAIRAEGHEIANHMPCDSPSHKLYKEAFKAQFLHAQERLVRDGVRPRWFRPAGGFYQEWMLETVVAHGYEPTFVLGSILPWDVTFHAPRLYAWHVGEGIFPGAIVVFHDGVHVDSEGARTGRVDRTLVSLEGFLRCMKSKGYEVGTLSGLIPEKTRDYES